MLCDRCKMKEAKIYYTEITGGKKIEQHLCEDCAAELTSFQKEIPLESILSGLLGINSSPDRVCSVCGMSYQEFQKAGKFGCANCYKTFGRFQEGNLKRIQGATSHTGKIAHSWQKQKESEEFYYEQEKTLAEQKEATQKETMQRNETTQIGFQAEQKNSEIGTLETGTSKNENLEQEDLTANIHRLEQALKEAITKEEYEEAAKLRDRIRELKASKEKGGCQECQKTD